VRKFGFFVVTLLISAVAHGDNEWVELWKHKKGEPKFEVKLSSFDSFDNIQHSKTLQILSRVIRPNGRIMFEQYSITDATCAQGYGSLMGDYMDGSPTEYATYVKGGGNGNAIIGDLLCQLGEEKAQETKEGN